MPVTRTSGTAQATAAEAGVVQRSVIRQTTADAAGSASPPTPVPRRNRPAARTLRRCRNRTALALVHETFAAQSQDERESEIASSGSSTGQPQSVLPVEERSNGTEPNKSESRLSDRRTPPADNTNLHRISRNLSTVLPANSSAAAQIVSMEKPSTWSGRVEGKTYTVRPREQV